MKKKYLLFLFLISIFQKIIITTGSSPQNLLTAKEIVSNLKVGINLGNSLESNLNEENWGNPATTQEIIDGLFHKDFSSIRIPIRWDQHFSNEATYTIHSSYLARVKQVVDYIYNKHSTKYIIINIHHDSIQEEYEESNKEKICDQLSKVWTQIANYFLGYDQRLIFEVINEPRNGNDWSGSKTEHDVVNYCNECARKAIRKTGGLNAKGRLIGLPCYAASAYISELKDWELNTGSEIDEYIAASIHGYIPSSFTDEDANLNSFDYNRVHNELDYHFKLIKKIFIYKNTNIPIYLGEFGSKNFINLEKRIMHVELYAKYARKYEIPIFWWDNGSSYAIYDRNTKQYIYPEIADAMIGVYNIENFEFNEDEGLYPFIFFNQSKIIDKWDSFEILTFKNSKGVFNPMLITKNTYFKIEYSCLDEDEENDCVNIILQSWSGGEGWTRVNGGNISYDYNKKRYIKKIDFDTVNETYNLSDLSLSLLDSVSVLATFSQSIVYSFSLELIE